MIKRAKSKIVESNRAGSQIKSNRAGSQIIFRVKTIERNYRAAKQTDLKLDNKPRCTTCHGLPTNTGLITFSKEVCSNGTMHYA